MLREMNIKKDIVVDDFSEEETKFNQQTFEMSKKKISELSNKYHNINKFQRFADEFSKLLSFEDPKNICLFFTYAQPFNKNNQYIIMFNLHDNMSVIKDKRL